MVRRFYRHFEETGDLALALCTPDATFDVSDVMPDMSGGHALADAERLFKSYSDTFDDFSIELMEIVAHDDNRVVTAVEDGGRIRGSEGLVRNRFFHTFTFEDGLLARWSSHVTAAQARAAVGL